jgi:hypothetical protein
MLWKGQRGHSNEDAICIQDIQAGGAHKWGTTQTQSKNAWSPDAAPEAVPFFTKKARRLHTQGVLQVYGSKLYPQDHKLCCQNDDLSTQLTCRHANS